MDAPPRGGLWRRRPVIAVALDHLALWAPVFALLYAAISLRVGDVFPFSKYSMYASTATRDRGAVLFFQADGEFVRVEHFVDYSGFDPDAILPRGIPCSLEWQVHEARRWIVNHAADGETPAAGRVAIRVGYRMLKILPDGQIHEELRTMAEGSARPIGAA